MSLPKATKPLSERLKESTKPQPVSMAPAPPPPKEKEHIPDLATILTKPKERLAVARGIARLGELSAQSSTIEKEKKPLSDWLKDVMGTYGVGKALCGAWKTNYYSSPRKTIKEDKLSRALLKRGIQPSEIDAILTESTEVSEGFTLRVTPNKDDEE